MEKSSCHRTNTLRALHLAVAANGSVGDPSQNKPVCTPGSGPAVPDGGAGMSEEDGFQAALDADPNDHNTRVIFADWLGDRDDPRAAGYRALGMLERVPRIVSKQCLFWNTKEHDVSGFSKSLIVAVLPEKWFLAIEGIPHERGMSWKSRREAEDAAALGFAALTPAEQAECLAAGVPV